MVRSENFHDILAMITASDKQGVVSFMRSQGISVNSGQDVKLVYRALHTALVSSNKFKNNFINWAETRYQGSSNASGNFDPMASQSGGFTPIDTQNGANLKDDQFANMGKEAMASGNFDPMATQSGGFTPIDTQNGASLKDDQFANASGNFDPMASQSGGFTPIDTQNGANLKDDQFANMGHDESMASGNFDPMATQSGGFTPISTQMGANLKDDQFANIGGLFKGDTPYDPNVAGSGSGLGNLFRKINFSDRISDGIDIWKTEQTSKQQQRIIDGELKAKQLELELLRETGELTQKQYEQQLALAKLDKNAPQSTVVLYVIGGVVLLAGIGTAIYFATRKK